MGTAAHSWVMSFASETESFRELQRLLGNPPFSSSILTILLQGARALRNSAMPLWGVRIDSGDFLPFARRSPHPRRGRAARRQNHGQRRSGRNKNRGPRRRRRADRRIRRRHRTCHLGRRAVHGSHLQTRRNRKRRTLRSHLKDSPDKHTLPGVKQLFRIRIRSARSPRRMRMRRRSHAEARYNRRPSHCAPAVSGRDQDARAGLAGRVARATRRTQISPKLEELNATLRGARVPE